MSLFGLTTSTDLIYADSEAQARLFTSLSSRSTSSFSPPTPPLSPLTPTSSDNTPPELPTWASISINDDSTSVQQISEFSAKYDFRLGPRDPDKSAYITWVDQDATGTYDPTSKHDPWLRPPLACISKQKRPHVERSSSYKEHQAKTPKTITWQRGRYEGKRLIVTLTFTRAHTVAALREYGTEFDSWPRPAHTLTNGYPDWKSWWNSSENGPNSDALQADNYDLRDRSGTIPCRYTADGDEIDLENVTLGHPAARGCKACFRLCHPCPLLEQGGKWPCNLCREENLECELIMEAQVKGRCTSCTKKRIVCSFADNGSVRGPCRQCDNSSLKCVAGPKNGRTRTGPSLDAGHVTDTEYDLGRCFVTCAQCRRDGKWCSLSVKRNDIPCNRCRVSGISCTFERLNRRIVDPRPGPEYQLVEREERGRDSDLPERQNGNLMGHPTTTITTKFAHPITFNYRPSDPQAAPCHWCDDLAYGILGIGEITIEVIDYKDKQGYVEVGGGHVATGHAPSRMCDMCTLERIMIAACRIHELEPIEGMSPDDFAFEMVVDYLMPGSAASAPFQWCSVCPAPAFFRCHKKMDIRMEGGNGERYPEGDDGCGLVLCEDCAVSLDEEHDGQLELMIDGMRVERAADAFSLRADVEFLHTEGELLRRMDIN